MEDQIKERLKKIYELVKHGSDGEKEAAQAAIDRLLKKYNLEDVKLDELELRQYSFPYATKMDHLLFSAIVEYFVECYLARLEEKECYRTTGSKKLIYIRLNYIDYVTVSCAYEYFKRHMHQQWKKVCAPLIANKRKPKTKAKLREQLVPLFMSKYIISSGLVKPEDIKTVTTDGMSADEIYNRLLLESVEGGQYNTQVNTGHLLEHG